MSADNLAGHLIYALGPEYVANVMVAGRWVLRAGQFVHCDETELRERAVNEAAALYGRMD